MRSTDRRKPPFFGLWINEPPFRGRLSTSPPPLERASPPSTPSLRNASDMPRPRPNRLGRRPFHPRRTVATQDARSCPVAPLRESATRSACRKAAPTIASRAIARKGRPRMAGTSPRAPLPFRKKEDGASRGPARIEPLRAIASVEPMRSESLDLDLGPGKTHASRTRDRAELLVPLLRPGGVRFDPRHRPTLTEVPCGGTLARMCFGSRDVRFRRIRRRSDAEPPRSSGKKHSRARAYGV